MVILSVLGRSGWFRLLLLLLLLVLLLVVVLADGAGLGFRFGLWVRAGGRIEGVGLEGGRGEQSE